MSDAAPVMTSYCRLIPRLNGDDIRDRFSHYRDLVQKGVAGFIVFGGELDTVKDGIEELGTFAHRPLIISSDLEQGLGQQLRGGTLFPPAMAIASAVSTLPEADALALLNGIYGAFAEESLFAGINAIYAPVLDINSNPSNPIIATRSFGESADEVSFCASAMIKVLQDHGILACGKHFPGHGDTDVDSHISLPIIRKSLEEMASSELLPFRKGIAAGIGMIMLGHLSVPAIDPSNAPASLSRRVVDYLRTTMGFKGLIITDAMNMGAIAGYSELRACAQALRSGADLILHPSDPHEVAAHFDDARLAPAPLMVEWPKPSIQGRPDFEANQSLSDKVSIMAVRTEGVRPECIRKPFVVVLIDDPEDKELVFVNELMREQPATEFVVLRPGEFIPWFRIGPDRDIVVAAYSTVRAWKTTTSRWLSAVLGELCTRASALVSFGNPYVYAGVRENVFRISAYWDGVAAQRAAAKRLLLSPGPL